MNEPLLIFLAVARNLGPQTAHKKGGENRIENRLSRLNSGILQLSRSV